jgi:hypothetical protein
VNHRQSPAKLDCMLSILRPIIWMSLRCLLPYPDRARRLRFRHAAYRLVTCEPWPGDDATGADAAQLALMHLLYLQRDAHRAVRWRQSEAAALLARSAVETCILGLYCLLSDDAPNALKARDGKAARSALTLFVAAGLVSQQVVDDAADRLSAGPQLPDVYRMAQQIDATGASARTLILYRDFYAPHVLTHLLVPS